jgi:hypothetical protein
MLQPSPLVGEGAERSEAGEGLSPYTPQPERNPSPVSPPLRVGDPPSPTGGEGTRSALHTSKLALQADALQVLLNVEAELFRAPEIRFRHRSIL